MRVARAIGLLVGTGAAGAVAFWTPPMVLRAISGSPGPGLLVVSVLGPFVIRSLAMRLWARLRGYPASSWIAEALLGGIWLLGPIFTMAALTLGGELGGARALEELRDLYTYPPLVPLVTLIFSGSDGSMVGLLIASCVLAYTSAELRPDPMLRWRCDPGGDLSWTRVERQPSGARCLVCATRVEAGQSLHLCPSCDSALHADCHSYLGGCARFGCPEATGALQKPCVPVL
jgi:hypothetical protein